MRVIRDTVGFIADITGILAFIGLSATGIIAWVGPKQGPAVIILLVIFGLLLITYLGLKKFAPDFSERAFHRPSTNKPLTLEAYNLKEHLPSSETLHELQSELHNRVQSWDKKATWVSSDFYTSINQDGQIYTLSVRVQSIWKRLEAEFSIKADGIQKTKVMEHYQPLKKSIKTSLDTAFFNAFPDWQEKVVLAYGPIEHRSKNNLYVKVGTAATEKELQVLVHDDSKEISKPKVAA